MLFFLIEGQDSNSDECSFLMVKNMNPVNSSSSSSVTRSHHSLKRSLASKAFNLNNSPDAMPGKVRRSSRAHNNVKYTYDDLRFVDSPSDFVVPLLKNIESESPNGYRIGDCSENPQGWLPL